MWGAERVAMKHSEARQVGSCGGCEGAIALGETEAGSRSPVAREAASPEKRGKAGRRVAISMQSAEKSPKAGQVLDGIDRMDWMGHSAAPPPPACRSAAGGRDSSWRRQRSPLGAVDLGQPLSAAPP